MSGKKIAFGTKPTAKPAAPAPVDTWVETRTAGEDTATTAPLKRLTIDVPESLHREIKAQCAMRGAKIADEVRELLLQKYGKA